MSRGLNRAVLIGNVGGAPEVRTAAGGRRIATFSLATSRRWTGRSGREQEKTEWHRVVAWDRLAEIVERYVRKGDRLYVDGRLEYRSWQDGSGHTRHVTEIVAQEILLLSGAQAGAGGGTSEPGVEEGPGESWSATGGRAADGPRGGGGAGPPDGGDEEDELPF